MEPDTLAPAGRDHDLWFRPAPHFLRFAVFTVGLALFGLEVTSAETLAKAAATEAKVKVAYIYNFPKFIFWPGDEKTGSSEPLRICVIGTDPIGATLTVLSKRKIKGRPINVIYSKDQNVPLPCHLLFITRSQERQIPFLLKQVQGAHVLTVSDLPQFAKKGGMIGFVTEHDRVKIEINHRILRQAGLRASAKVLEIARVVQ